MRHYLHLILYRGILGCILAVAMLLTGCKDKKNGFDPSKPTVTVTIEPFRYFVEQVAGDEFNINVMVPAGSNPETYEPTTKQMMELSHSDFYFKVGELGFEKTWMDKLQKNAPKMEVIDTSERLDSAIDGDGHKDPHTWMSVKNVKTIAYTIRDALSMKYPEKAQEFYKRCEDFNERLSTMSAFLDRLYFSTRKQRHTGFVIYHPILTHYIQDYPLEQYAMEEEGREPSIKRIQKLIDITRKKKIEVLFVQKEFANRNVQTFLKATHLKTVEINPLSYDWEKQMLLIMTSLRKKEPLFDDKDLEKIKKEL